MPLYNFICQKCNKHFERLLKMVHDEVERACPTCQSSENVQRSVTSHGSYTIKGDNSASTRPKGGGR